MPQKKRPSSKSLPKKNASAASGNHNILDTDGLKTSGLTANKNILLPKGVGKYQVQSKSGLASRFEQEKEKATQKQELLKSLHPGWTAPEQSDFTGLSLSNRDLERIRFKNSLMKCCKFLSSKLRGVRWKNCDLRGADFRHADLRDCILDGCNLNGADLRHANLTNARVIDSDLSAANFDHAVLDMAVVENCDMSAQTFHNSSCREIHLYNSQIIHGFFDNADFSQSEIQDMEFRHCTLTKTSFNHAEINNTSFKGCESFDEGPSFANAKMNEVTMVDCELQSVSLDNTEISRCLWERVSLTNAQLDNTVFNKVSFNEGAFTDCFSVEKAPTFNYCHLNHWVIEHTDLTDAHFSKSRFAGTIIKDSDVEQWQLHNTRIDPDTMIE
ncbi:pentapeptide repeat-containing protein [Endozoicomonas sp. SCSIO W0465]|uniref:pentapeptide repeat-containing protein n=1 Tax=Endozoicomonas sp. SCSIO W0465 TaxID=2918516 RepID=UPI002074C720|nr:pentapeptide repeat-containing protein [Endozoicomonas sp. SCSIO W0465]USE37014.1 pentapeptide repeat-containing protein [Endozoicomonas sp. SCSIO W0465]